VHDLLCRVVVHCADTITGSIRPCYKMASEVGYVPEDKHLSCCIIECYLTVLSLCTN